MKRLFPLSLLLICASIAAFSQSVNLNIPAVDSTGATVTTGTAYITWDKFTSANGTIVFGTSKTVAITSGTISITLYASDTAGYVYNILIEGNNLNSTYQWKVLAAGGISTYVAPTSGSGSGNSGANCTTYTISSSQLTAASTLQDVSLFTLPQNAKVSAVTIREATTFAGPTGLTAMTVSIGRGSSSPSDYQLPFPLFQATNTIKDTSEFYSPTYASNTVYAEFVNTTATSPINLGTGSVSNLTGGQEVITVCTVQLQ